MWKANKNLVQWLFNDLVWVSLSLKFVNFVCLYSPVRVNYEPDQIWGFPLKGFPRILYLFFSVWWCNSPNDSIWIQIIINNIALHCNLAAVARGLSPFVACKSNSYLKQQGGGDHPRFRYLRIFTRSLSSISQHFYWPVSRFF